MPVQSPDYMAYLLRLWSVRDVDAIQWRASLEDAQTGERHGFADLDRLCEFLQERFTDAGDASLTLNN
jgi:hypothetical protein